MYIRTVVNRVHMSGKKKRKSSLIRYIRNSFAALYFLQFTFWSGPAVYDSTVYKTILYIGVWSSI